MTEVNSKVEQIAQSDRDHYDKGIGWKIYLRSIITLTSNEVKIAFAIRDQQFQDELTNPVLGLYTHLEHYSWIVGRGNKRPYIKQGLF